jgi:hypothetical protein
VSEWTDELRSVVERYPADERLAPYLAKVRERAYAVTDRDVQELKDAGIDEDTIFEQTAAAAVGEGLRRLDAAEAVIR